jgi:ComF family protein
MIGLSVIRHSLMFGSMCRHTAPMTFAVETASVAPSCALTATFCLLDCSAPPALLIRDRLDLAPMMGRWIGQAGREVLADADALVPVPLHWRRLWARRFNQSAMLAAAISRQTRVPVAAGALKRVKPTAQQVGLSRTERAANVQGAFRVPDDGKAAVTGRRLVLIDDVLTSGATVDGCARALLRAGAANVDVLVFARVAEPARTSL